jgi:hypothetical protein
MIYEEAKELIDVRYELDTLDLSPIPTKEETLK